MFWKSSVAAATVLAVSSLAAFDAVAQGVPPRGDTVATRYRPELEPLGVRAGTFLFFPKLGISETYDDNIFATEHDTDDDFITILQPEVSLESDWANHALNFRAGADLGFYADHSDEDYKDYFTRSDGRLDITRDANMFYDIGFLHGHDPRGEPDDSGGKKPDEYNNFDGTFGYDHRFGRFRSTIDGNAEYIDYDDTDANNNNVINNDDRDRIVYGGGTRLGYEFEPGYEAFIHGTANRRLYDQQPDDAGNRRDSYGYNIVGGISFDFDGILFGNAYAGYQEQIYEHLNDIRAPSFGLGADWNVTTLTTVSANVDRAIEETIDRDATGFIRTTGRLSVDHELLRNLILNANVSVTNNNYEGSSRDDYIYTTGAGARYLINRWVYGTFTYQFRRRNSQDGPGDGESGEDPDFTENVFRIGLELQL